MSSLKKTAMIARRHAPGELGAHARCPLDPRSGCKLRAVQKTWIALFILFILSLAGCSGSSARGPEDASIVVALPGPPGAPPLPVASSSPKGLAGVDTGGMVEREQKVWWKLMSELYSPCADQAVSVAQCVEEARPCAACTPAANFLAAKVQKGAMVDEVRAAYGLRFGPNIKRVDPADSPSRGPLDAPVTIVVWSDFECPHCRFTMPILDGLLKKYSPRVRLVHKFYPLRSHTNAEPAARAAIAAQNQGRYWEMERTLFANQGKLSPSDLDQYATSLQLDMNRYRADFGSSRTDAVLARDRDDADRLGLAGTPFILINGREFALSYFHLDGELEAWVALEVDLTGQKTTPAKAAAP
jgi:protein-disulfide isomerase